MAKGPFGQRMKARRCAAVRPVAPPKEEEKQLFFFVLSDFPQRCALENQIIKSGKREIFRSLLYWPMDGQKNHPLPIYTNDFTLLSVMTNKREERRLKKKRREVLLISSFIRSFIIIVVHFFPSQLYFDRQAVAKKWEELRCEVMQCNVTQQNVT